MTRVDKVEPLPSAGSGGLLTRHPLVSYFVIAYAVAWAIEIPLALSASGILPKVPHLLLIVGIIAATLAPAAAAIIMTGLLEGKAGVARLLRRYVQWRVGVRWYLFVLVGIPIIIVLATIVIPGAIGAFTGNVGALLVAYPLHFLITVFCGGPLGEEAGWRGFALPRLQERHGPLLGSTILGVLWSLWHFPLFWTGVWNDPTIVNMVLFIVAITALTIIMSWVYNHVAGSLLITMLMHATFNTFANYFDLPLFPAPTFNQFGLLPLVIGFGVTAMVLIVVTRGRLGYRAGVGSTEPDSAG